MTRCRATPLNWHVLGCDCAKTHRCSGATIGRRTHGLRCEDTTHRGHCLNQTAAAVRIACDGRTTITKITRDLQETVNSGIDQRVVWLALNKLENAGLLMKGL